MHYEFPINSEEKRVVFCDGGGVIALLCDIHVWYKKLYCASSFSTREEFKKAKAVAEEIAWEPFERGEITTTEFYTTFSRIMRLDHLSAFEFWKIYVDIFEGPNLPMIKCLQEMRERGIVLALLSNVDRERWLYFNKNLAKACCISVFHTFLLSFEIGARKPEQKIYHHAFEMVSILPQNAYYIDDWKPNIEGMAAAIPDMPRENMHLYDADRHDEDAIPFFRLHGLIG